MAENKTRENHGDVDAFIDALEEDRKRGDARALRMMMERITGEPAKTWGDSIVGFGKRHLVYDSGRELESFYVGFSPRKHNLTVYVMDGFSDYEKLLGKLGKHSTGKSCLYIKRLDDVDTEVLEDLVTRSVEHVRSGA